MFLKMPNTNLNHKKVDLLKPTLIFTVVGLFIPGFTAVGLFGLQMLLSSLGLECVNAWILLWTITIVGGIVLPILFYKYLKTLTEIKRAHLKTRLTFFNLFEYIFIQASLVPFFADAQTLCSVSDGQNGLEFVFTAWIALPFLIGLSYFFNQNMELENI